MQKCKSYSGHLYGHSAMTKFQNVVVLGKSFGNDFGVH